MRASLRPRTAYRAAHESQATLIYSDKPQHVYHSLNPHPAFDPHLSTEAQNEAERIYRQLLIQGVLAVLLPTEDLQNSSLRILVTDIIADLILGKVIEDRLCEGWFLHESVSKVTAAIVARAQPKVTGEEMQVGAKTRLEKFGLLSAKDDSSHAHSPTRSQSPMVSWFWSILQWLYLAFIAARFAILGLVQARRIPPRSSTKHGIDQTEHPPVLVLDYGIFSLVSTLLNLSMRMPWLTGALALCTNVLTSGRNRWSGPSSTLDR
jgi:hypothetical protein